MIFYFLRRPKISVLLILACVALAIYGFSLSFGFVLDDEAQIVNNAYIHSVGNLLGAFTGSTMDAPGARRMAGIYYKPMMTVSYILLWAVAQKAWVFHLFQLVLHVLNSFLVFLFFLFLVQTDLNQFGKRARRSEESQTLAGSPSWSQTLFCFWVALAYLVHPMNVETIVYIADLQDVLFSFFGLLALNWVANLKAVTFKSYWVLGVLLELSLLSKESGILYLIIVGTYCLIFRPSILKVWWGGAIGALVLYFGLRVGLAELTHGGNTSQMLRADLGDRLTTMPKILFHYFILFFFPKELTLVQDWVVKELTFQEFWAPLAGLLAILYGAWKLFRNSRDRVLYFFLFWFVLGMGAHSNLVPLDGTVADRWFYFPMIGLLGVLGTYFKNEKGAFYKTIFLKYRLLSILLLSGLILGWSVRSFARTLDWETSFLLYQHDLDLMPDNFYLTNNIGVEFFRSGKIVESVKYFNRSTELFPGWATSWSNLGTAYERLGYFAEAEKCLLRSVRNGASANGYEAYTAILLKQGKKAAAQEFLEKEGFRVFPDNQVLKALYAEVLR